MQSQNDSIINKDMSFCILSEDKMFKIAKGYSSVSKTIRLSEEKAEYLGTALNVDAALITSEIVSNGYFMSGITIFHPNAFGKQPK